MAMADLGAFVRGAAAGALAEHSDGRLVERLRAGRDEAAFAAVLAHAAYAEGVSLREANRKLGCLTQAEFDRLLRPEAMTRPSRRPVDASPKL